MTNSIFLATTVTSIAIAASQPFAISAKALDTGIPNETVLVTHEVNPHSHIQDTEEVLQILRSGDLRKSRSIQSQQTQGARESLAAQFATAPRNVQEALLRNAEHIQEQ